MVFRRIRVEKRRAARQALAMLDRTIVEHGLIYFYYSI